MKAIVFEKVGGPEVLKISSVPKPSPNAGEVIVKVRACALNRIDYYLRIEEDDAMPMPHILGSDVAGVVESVGDKVTGWKAGDAVIVCPSITCGECEQCRAGNESLCDYFRILGYQTQGGYAEYVTVPARNLIQKPERLTYEEAAAIPMVYVTTFHQLFTRGKLRPSETVLVMGANSGIGSAAIQLCNAAGARVIATIGRDDRRDQVTELGAHAIVNHKSPSWPSEVLRLTNQKGVSLICEHFGGEYLTQCLSLLSVGGRLITIGYTAGSQLTIDLGTILRKQITFGTSYMGSKMELLQALKLMDIKNVKPAISNVFPLDEARKAHELMESRNHFGKIVLRVS